MYVKLSLSKGIHEANAFPLWAGNISMNCSTVEQATTRLFHNLKTIRVNCKWNTSTFSSYFDAVVFSITRVPVQSLPPSIGCKQKPR